MNEERVAIASTALFSLVVLLGALSAVGRSLVVVLSAVMFLGGAVLMAVALVIAAGRSRQFVIAVGDVFFRVPRAFIVCFGVQIFAAFASAGAHPHTGAAFAILAPVFGLGIMGLWGARHGQFPARET
ncbi:MAG TPA: hypothetical protein VHD87_08345, partial [Acidimicrobiales bacterium]|nr:hypothetical protein [Acidimicrobiales bacterium]